ncbi:MAG TPA: hypothetical protein VIN72_10745 [Lutibacter sp.]
MKKINKFFNVAVITTTLVFMTNISNAQTQITFDDNLNSSTEIDKLQTIETESFSYDSKYFEKFDATINIIIDKNGKIISITDSSKSLPDALIIQIISQSNSLAADSCGCYWYQILCKAYCALEKGLEEQN